MEWNLTRIYRKLGVRSKIELAAQIDLQLVLAQELVRLGNELEVDVDRRRAPAVEHCGGTAGQVGRRLLARLASERPHKAADARGVA